jgi:hypothetical protein
MHCTSRYSQAFVSARTGLGEEIGCETLARPLSVCKIAEHLRFREEAWDRIRVLGQRSVGRDRDLASLWSELSGQNRLNRRGHRATWRGKLQPSGGIPRPGELID